MKIIRYVFLPILIFIFFFSLYKYNAINYSSKYHFDERDWIARGFYFDLLIKGDFKNDLWKNYEVDGDPKLTSYIYGLSLYPDYLKAKKGKSKDYDMLRYLIDNNFYPKEYLSKSMVAKYDKYVPKNFISWSSKSAAGKTRNELLKIYGSNFQKTVDLIFKIEKTSILFLTLSIIIAYFIVLISTNSIIASILAVFLYGISYIVYEYGTIAYSECLLLFLINLSVLDLIVFFNSRKQIVKNLCFTTFPIIAALANQTKSNGVLLMGIFYVILILGMFFHKKNNYIIEIKFLLFKIIISTLIFIFIYVLTDPFLWNNPFKNTIFQYQWTYKITLGQQKEYPNEALFTKNERVIYIYNYIFKNKYGGGLRPIFIKNWSISKIYSYITGIFFIVGIISICKKIAKNKKITGDTIVLIYTALFFIFLSLYLMLVWERYMIHLIFFIFYIAVHGLSFIIDGLKYKNNKLKI